MLSKCCVGPLVADKDPLEGEGALRRDGGLVGFRVRSEGEGEGWAR